jgi:hypothetical protein
MVKIRLLVCVDEIEGGIKTYGCKIFHSFAVTRYSGYVSSVKHLWYLLHSR